LGFKEGRHIKEAQEKAAEKKKKKKK